jgi:myo-inositol-1(or 4)-monophosphatase
MTINVQTICGWAYEAGTIAMSHFRRTVGSRKADDSLVTIADTEIEQFLREQIHATFPDHGIQGEEQGSSNIEQEYVWSLDPIDGTNAFASGLPIWGISLGLLQHGIPILGVIYLPVTDDCFWSEGHDPADDGAAAFWNGVPIRVRSAPAAPAAPYDGQDWLAITSDAHLHYHVRFRGKTRSTGSTAAHMCYVAQGIAVGALLGHAQLWDIAAGVAIVTAAGGVVTHLHGSPPDYAQMLRGTAPPSALLVAPPHMLPILQAEISLLA